MRIFARLVEARFFTKLNPERGVVYYRRAVVGSEKLEKTPERIRCRARNEDFVGSTAYSNETARKRFLVFTCQPEIPMRNF